MKKQQKDRIYGKQREKKNHQERLAQKSKFQNDFYDNFTKSGSFDLVYPSEKLLEPY